MGNNKTGMDEELRLTPEETEGADANATSMGDELSDRGTDFAAPINEQIAKSRMVKEIIEFRGKGHSGALV